MGYFNSKQIIDFTERELSLTYLKYILDYIKNKKDRDFLH